MNLTRLAVGVTVLLTAVVAFLTAASRLTGGEPEASRSEAWREKTARSDREDPEEGQRLFCYQRQPYVAPLLIPPRGEGHRGTAKQRPEALPAVSLPPFDFSEGKPSKAGRVLLAEEFESGETQPGWTFDPPGCWQVVEMKSRGRTHNVLRLDGTGRGNPGSAATALLDHPEWRDYRVALRFRMTEGSNASFGFREQPANGAVRSVRLQAFADCLTAYADGSGNLRADKAVASKVPGQASSRLREGAWYELQVRLKGPEVHMNLGYVGPRIVKKIPPMMPLFTGRTTLSHGGLRLVAYRSILWVQRVEVTDVAKGGSS